MALEQCQMCALLINRNQIMNHVVRVHKFEPNFKVFCSYTGCGSSYTNWDSFRKHVSRKHNLNLAEEELMEVDDNIPDDNIPDAPENNDNDNAEVAGMQPSIAYLKEWHAVTFAAKLKEENILPDSTVQSIVTNVQEMMQQQLRSLQAAIKQDGQDAIPIEHINEVFQEALGTHTLKAVHSSYHRKKYLQENCSLVSAKRTQIGQIRSWTSEGRLQYTDANAYVVPFLDDLETLLNNKDVLFCVQNPRKYTVGVYQTVLDGSSYRENSHFLSDPRALSVIIYFDEVEFCNPLGSKKRKLGMFYYMLGNIYPELRSSLRAINLLAIVDASHLKRFGLKVVLQSFIDDMKKLSLGIKLRINNQVQEFTGFIQMVVGDTPASNFLGGFKESVGKAHRPCRTCLILNSDLGNVSTESEVVLRNKVTHSTHIERVCDPNLRAVNQQNWSKRYGVKDRSVLLDLDDFDATKAFPHDFMHVVIESTLETECRYFLNHCVSNGKFTLGDLNNAISSFNYGHMIKDKPSAIETQHLTNGLRQSAAQLLALGFVLPFLVAPWLDDSLEEYIHNFIVLTQIVNMSLAYVVTSKEIRALQKMTQVYIVSRLQLYPNESAVPKLHYMVHLPNQIARFGPLRQHWCFRFEAAHQYFKNLAGRVKNFRNLPQTFADRRQALKCVQLAAPANSGSKTFLYLGDDVTPGDSTSVLNHPDRDVLVPTLTLDCEIMTTARVAVHGTAYKKSSVLLIANNKDDLPEFATVKEIVVVGKKYYLIHSELETVDFNDRLNAYEVKKRLPVVSGLVAVSDLLHPHPLSIFKCEGKLFVVLMYHRRTEFIG